MDKVMKCCTIGCESDADYEVRGNVEHPDNYTHSCEAHLADAMSSPEFLIPRANQSWSVAPIMREPIPKRWTPES